LRDLKARWQDDAYAEQQIRDRLHYVMPGETGYIVIDPDAAKQSASTRGRPTVPGTRTCGTAWTEPTPPTAERTDRPIDQFTGGPPDRSAD